MKILYTHDKSAGTRWRGRFTSRVGPTAGLALAGCYWQGFFHFVSHIEVFMHTALRNFLVIACVTLLAACSSGNKTEPAPITSAGNGSGNGTSQSQGVAPVTTQTSELNNPDNLNNPNSPLAKRSIYFDFDSYTVKPEFQSLLEAHAKYLIAHPQQHILIQGNTDERGTSEYNLALGEKRSEAVLKYLALLGVPNNQMEAVSLGKEQPRALGHDEAAWAENRRADIVYK